MDYQQFHDFMINMPEVELDYPFGENTAVYKSTNPPYKIIAIAEKDAKPLRVSLKCDPLLAKTLRERYETVLEGQNLSKKHWNTIICSGQLSEQEIFDLARLSYQLAQQVD